MKLGTMPRPKSVAPEISDRQRREMPKDPRSVGVLAIGKSRTSSPVSTLTPGRTNGEGVSHPQFEHAFSWTAPV